MAIQNEIDRIEDSKAFLRAAIIDITGGEVPTEHQWLDDYAQIINDIDLGGIMTDEVKAIVNRTAKSVVVPATVTFLRPCVFWGCTALEEIVMLPTTPPTQGNEWCEGTTCTIYVPDESVTIYQSNWTDLASRIQALSARTMTYDFANATEDNEVIPTDSTKSRTVSYITNGGTVGTLTGWMTTEYDGLYLQGSTYNNLFFNKRIGSVNGLYNKATGNRAFSIDTKGYNTITLNNGHSMAWTSDSFPYVENGTITVANDGMSATITVNQGATKVDVTTIRYVAISTMVFTM